MRKQDRRGLRLTVSGALAAAALSTWMLGCASTPPAAVQNARAELDRIESDPDVSDHASLQLYEAQQAVERLERADRDDEDRIEHLAYLAQRRIEIARQAAEAGAYRSELEQLGERRDAVRLEAREITAAEAQREAALARLEAQQARAEAERARETASARGEQADQALQRAKELEARLADVKAEQTERGVVLTLDDVLFEFDRAELLPGAERSLRDVAGYLNEFSERAIAVEGHTDSVGSETYNQQLSEQRARAVADYLRSEGVNGERIEVIGLGESAPVAPNDTNAGRQQNRRVEIVLDHDDTA